MVETGKHLKGPPAVEGLGEGLRWLGCFLLGGTGSKPGFLLPTCCVTLGKVDSTSEPLKRGC